MLTLQTIDHPKCVTCDHYREYAQWTGDCSIDEPHMTADVTPLDSYCSRHSELTEQPDTVEHAWKQYWRTNKQLELLAQHIAELKHIETLRLSEHCLQPEHSSTVRESVASALAVKV